jgi:ADP-ribosylglycohydrolase
MDAPGEDRFIGCLIGQCLGDALGFVVEGHGPAACRRYVDQVLKSGRAGAMGRAPFPFGQYSDDSQLARELLQSYVELGCFDAADYARRIAAIFAEQRIVGRGRATEQASQRLAAGVPWQQSGTPPPSAGNGSAMRAGPVGLLFHADDAALARAAHDQGRITHADPRCSAGAVAIAGAVAWMARGAAPEPGALLARLADLAGTLEPGFAQHLGALEGWLALAPEAASGPISRAGLEPGHGDAWPGISPFVVPSVLWSLYAVLRSPDDYWETMCTAIAVGGDVDTTAAMAGAVSGARVGLEGLPLDLARRLGDRGTWGFGELEALARAAHAIAVASPAGD